MSSGDVDGDIAIDFHWQRLRPLFSQIFKKYLCGHGPLGPFVIGTVRSHNNFQSKKSWQKVSLWTVLSVDMKDIGFLFSGPKDAAECM